VPNIETAAVKEGIRRGPATGLTGEQNKKFNGAAIHLHPLKARQLIKEGMRRALAKRHEIKPFWLEPPYELVSIIRRDGDVPPRVAHVTGNDLLEVLRAPRKYEVVPDYLPAPRA
jgi:hypothetical protein